VPKPWNRWLHCILGTYGSWLPGEPRGFRTRHHREHVEGNYRNPPPPGLYEHRHEHARELMRHPRGNLRTNGRYAIAGHILGRAKRAASVQMNRQAGKTQGRPLWARRPALKPIAHRGHQLAVVRYIRNHAAHGAAVWPRIR